MITSSSIEGVEELSNGGGDFKSSKKNSFLSLNLDISGPSDESGFNYFGSNAVTKSEVSLCWLSKRMLFIYFFNLGLSVDILLLGFFDLFSI